MPDLAGDDVAEHLPRFAVELHQLHLFDREEVVGCVPREAQLGPRAYFMNSRALADQVANILRRRSSLWILRASKYRRCVQRHPRDR